MAHFFFPVCPLALPFLQGEQSHSHIAQEQMWALRHLPTACSLLTQTAFMLFNPETGLPFPAQSKPTRTTHASTSASPPMLSHYTAAGAISPDCQYCSYMGVQVTKANFIWYQKALLFLIRVKARRTCLHSQAKIEAKDH